MAGPTMGETAKYIGPVPGTKNDNIVAIEGSLPTIELREPKLITAPGRRELERQAPNL